MFDYLRTHVLPALAGRNHRLRIWSAACSTGAELYSMAILLSEAGLLERSDLLGTDCRGDAIERAKAGLYDAAALKLVPSAARAKYFEPAGQHWRPAAALRRQAHWKAADLLAGVENGPWDVILWRNAAIYLKSRAAETVWRRLASVLAPEGVLVAGKADRPPGERRVDACRPVRLSCCRRPAASPWQHGAIASAAADWRRTRSGAVPMSIGSKDRRPRPAARHSRMEMEPHRHPLRFRGGRLLPWPCCCRCGWWTPSALCPRLSCSIRQSSWWRASAAAGRGSWPPCSRRWRPLIASCRRTGQFSISAPNDVWPWGSSPAPACF